MSIIAPSLPGLWPEPERPPGGPSALELFEQVARRRVELFVVGDPRPMGSKTAFVIPGTNRAVMTDGSSAKPAVKRLKAWKASVCDEALRVAQEGTFDGGLRVHITFALLRPAGHLSKKTGAPTPSAPRWPEVKPDVDKLARQVLDCLTQGGLIRDDSRVVELVARKVYAEPGKPTGALIVVEEMA